MTESEFQLERVKSWSEKAAACTASRDLAICEAVTQGHSLRTVAHAANLSHAAIARIVKRTDAP